MNGVTVYLVIVLPPLLDGAVQLTFADPLPAVAVTPVGAPGAPGWNSDTSSRYIHVSSGGFDWSWCTLNQSTTFWPAHWVMSKVTWVHCCEFEALLKMLASVTPVVLRTCASCQSNAQLLPEQMSSAVLGRYQKLRLVVPVGGIVTVWDTLLSPTAAVAGWTTPSNAELLPEWNWAVLVVGGSAPPVVQDVRPFSNPP